MNSSPPTRSAWPYGLVAFFAVFISWIAIFIGLAVSHSSELVGADYYEQEIRYQERIDSARRASGTRDLVLRYDEAAGRVVFQLPREHRDAPAEGVIRLYRPNDAQLDRTLDLRAIAVGETGSAVKLEPGPWKLEAHWKHDRENYYTSTNIVVAPR